jgi:hypothetical protein
LRETKTCGDENNRAQPQPLQWKSQSHSRIMYLMIVLIILGCRKCGTSPGKTKRQPSADILILSTRIRVSPSSRGMQPEINCSHGVPNHLSRIHPAAGAADGLDQRRGRSYPRNGS